MREAASKISEKVETLEAVELGCWHSLQVVAWHSLHLLSDPCPSTVLVVIYSW